MHPSLRNWGCPKIVDTYPALRCHGGGAMGPRRRKQYTAEFREEIVKLILSGEKSVPRVSREFAVPKGTVQNWMMKAR